MVFGDCSIWFHFRPAHQLLPSQRPGVRKCRWLSGELFPPTGRSKMTSIHKNVKSFMQITRVTTAIIRFDFFSTSKMPGRFGSAAHANSIILRAARSGFSCPGGDKQRAFCRSQRSFFFRWGKAGKS